MSIASEIERIDDAKHAIKAAIEAKTETTIPEAARLEEYPALIEAIEGKPKLQVKSAVPTTEYQVITPDEGYDGLERVLVANAALEEKNVTPTTSGLVVSPTGENIGLSKVNVMGDGNLTSSNIKKGTTIFGVTGSYDGDMTTVNAAAADIYDWCLHHGAYMPSLRNLENLAACVKSISEIEYVTVSFDTGTIESFESQTIVYGHPAELPIPTVMPEEGKIFDCWTLNGVKVTGSTPITQNCTLVPRWAGVLYLIEENFNTTAIIGKKSNRITTSFYRHLCTSITFLNDGSVPANAVTSWDVSRDADGSIMAYIDTNSTSSQYNLYISGNGKIVLPANSSYLFYYYGRDITIAFNNLNSLDTSQVTNMSYLFKEVGKVDLLDLSAWNTSNVTNMAYMFSARSFEYIKELNVVGFNTKNVTSMYYMFHNYRPANNKVLDLSTFEINSKTDLDRMLEGTNLEILDIRRMDFTGKDPLKTINSSTFKYSCKVYCKDQTAKNWLKSSGYQEANITIVGE